MSPEKLDNQPASTGTDQDESAPGLFPVFLKLTGRRCLVVGAGTIAESKIESLLAAGASVTVVAPIANEVVRSWASRGRIEWQPREFEPVDVANAFLVVAATSSSAVNGAVYQEAQRRGVLCNAVDDPPNCDFYYPSVVRRGALQIAISTDGKSPALAQRLRRELEVQFGPAYAGWVEFLGAVRDRVRRRPIEAERRRSLLHALAGPRGFEAYRRASTAGVPNRVSEEVPQ